MVGWWLAWSFHEGFHRLFLFLASKVWGYWDYHDPLSLGKSFPWFFHSNTMWCHVHIHLWLQFNTYLWLCIVYIYMLIWSICIYIYIMYTYIYIYNTYFIMMFTFWSRKKKIFGWCSGELWWPRAPSWNRLCWFSWAGEGLASLWCYIFHDVYGRYIMIYRRS
jgi:hypothetical protein